MSLIEETIDATLDSNSQLQLSHQPKLPPGPVQVTIRAVAMSKQRRSLADVIRQIAAGQRARGFPGRLAAEMSADDAASQQEDLARDKELETARRAGTPGSP